MPRLPLLQGSCTSQVSTRVPAGRLHQPGFAKFKVVTSGTQFLDQAATNAGILHQPGVHQRPCMQHIQPEAMG